MAAKVLTVLVISFIVYIVYIVVGFVLKNTALIVNLHFNKKEFGRENKKKQIRIAWYKLPPRWLPSSFNFNQCKFSNCELSKRGGVLSLHEAIVFFYRGIGNKPPRKRSGQLWIAWTAESPANERTLPQLWNGLFDWSITYSNKSEVQHQRILSKRQKSFYRNYSEVFRKKTKLVSWVVSNCKTQSLRQKYVKELKKYIPVDIFGRCVKSNKNVCSKINRTDCHIKLSNTYKFYLGFENSLCKDYVTEKVYDNFLEDNSMVYVARGAPNIEDLIPDNTIINTAHFKNPEELANYLTALGANETAYTKYLREKDKYEMINNRNIRSWCSLCELLNTYQSRKLKWSGRTFPDWFGKSMCTKPKDITF